MARKRSRSSNNLTYDSKETRTVLGLLAFLLAFTLLISVFVDSRTPNFFTQIRAIFGQSTLFIAFFSLNLGLFLFKAKLPFASKSSVIAQLVLVFLIPAFLTSLHRSKAEAVLATSQGLSGGQIGYTLAYQLFADTLVFAQFTPLILGIAVLIFLPIAFSMSISRLIEILAKVLSWAGTAISNLFAHKEKIEEHVNKLEMVKHAQRFGDFQRVKEGEKPDKSDKANHDDKPATKSGEALPTQQSLEKIAADSNVEIKEAQLGEEGLSQSQLMYPNWQLPPISLLSPYQKKKAKDPDIDHNSEVIKRTLASFRIDVEIVETFVGPSVVRYALSIPMGITVDKIANLSSTLALGLGVDSSAIRVDTIPGTTYLGVEVPRQNRDFVQIRELLESESIKDKKLFLPITIGKDIDGSPVLADIQRMPHLLIAGATGSGKSVLTNSFIVSLLMHRTPDELRMILVDPKQVELIDYNGIPHLLTPVITDMDKVVNALKWAVDEMERRYTVLAHSQVRNIEGYNQKIGFSAMPYIVVVIDEMADMMMTANRVDAETAIVRLTQKARAVGIHLILATQRPSVKVITGLIKANVPARIGMSVTSNVDSRVILDTTGAESLMGRGDLLFKAPDSNKVARLQGPGVSQEEIGRVVNFIKSQVPEVQYITSILEGNNVSGGAGISGDIGDDDMFAQAVRIVVNHDKGSASFLQRKLNVGFNRAARMLEEMEELGIVGAAQGSKPREVLISDPDEFLRSLKENQG